MDNNLIEKISEYLLETEGYANEFLPLKNTLQPIQEDFNIALNELKNKIETNTAIADKVFYINRYTDLVKKIESVFDMRNKRLQQVLQILTKMPEQTKLNTESVDDSDSAINKLTPEKANEILKILKNN